MRRHLPGQVDEVGVEQVAGPQARARIVWTATNNTGHVYVLVSRGQSVEVAKYQYQLEQTVAYAPAAGYVINLQLRPGQFARLKAPVLSFVSSEEAWLVMAIRQEGSQYVEPGQELEFALTMYPGEVFTAKVGALIHGAGEAQLSLGGVIPSVASIKEIEYFAVKVPLDEDQLERPMIFGASGIAAIKTGRGADVFWLLRRIEIQSESLLNYVYNPFRG